MKWLIVVLFATAHGDVYIFTEPSFDDRATCMASIKDPEDQKRYVQKLVLTYNRLLPIMAVNCLSEETIEDILSKNKDEKTSI